MTHTYVAIYLVLLAVLNICVTGQTAPAQPAGNTGTITTTTTNQKATPLPPEKLKGKIAYIQGNSLWVVAPETREKHLLLRHTALAAFSDIAFSPDLTQIAFSSYVPTPGWEDVPGSEIFVMRSDGTQKRSLTKHAPNRAHQPRWSPDGKRIAYTVSTHYIVGSSSDEVRVMDADGKNDRLLAGTSFSGGPAAYEPFWSRDSQRIVFTYFAGVPGYEDLGGPQREQRIIALGGRDGRRDGAIGQPFDGDWSPFDTPFVAHDGKWMAKFDLSVGSSGRLDLLQLPENKRFRTLWFGGTGNLTLHTPIFGPNSEQIAAHGLRAGLIIDDQGYAQIDQSYVRQLDIWLVNRNGDIPIRLLVENARLIDWL